MFHESPILLFAFLSFKRYHNRMKCHCGCGNDVPLNKYRPRRFVLGHCAEFHAKPNRKTVLCVACKKSMNLPPWRIRRSKKIACSTKCMGAYNSTSRIGKNHPSWLGGKQMTAGYVTIYAPNHPAAHRNYVYEHRLVMEKKLGRYLDSSELVHHVNHDKLDNRPQNLQLVTRSHHINIHRN